MGDARSRRAFGRATALAAVLICALPGSSRAFSKAVWGPVVRNGVNQFPIFHQLGASIYETQLHWNLVAPTQPANPTDPNDPAYQWPADIDQAVTQGSAFHMRVMLQIIGTPTWANGGRPSNWAPTNRTFFSDFATAAARHYGTVHLWMIWGEPSRQPDFQPLTPAKPGHKLNAAQRNGPHIYARMLDAAYGALKQVDPHNLVIGGCTFTTGDIDTEQWIQNLRLPNGRAPRMDLYAHNPFGPTRPSFSDPPSPNGQVHFSDLPRLAQWIDRYLRRGMKIFLSEYTIPTAPDEEFPYWVDAPVAASWIKDALRLSRHWSRIYALGWVNLYDRPPYTYGGLLDSRGRPKPLFNAFARN